MKSLIAAAILITTPSFATVYECFDRTGRSTHGDQIVAHFNIRENNAAKVCVAGTEPYSFSADEYKLVSSLHTGLWETWTHTNGTRKDEFSIPSTRTGNTYLSSSHTNGILLSNVTLVCQEAKDQNACAF